MLICKHCSNERKSLKSLVNHERLCPNNPTRKYVSHTLGKEAWNKGKTQHEIPSLARLTQRGKKFGSAITGHSEETKQKISKKLSINNKGGRAKWYIVAGQNVQGTWERDIATKLTELSINWVKLKTNKDTLQYVMDGKIRNYTPDFYLPDYNMYVEIKGYWWGNDREKMRIVLETYPDIKIAIVEKDEYKEIMLL